MPCKRARDQVEDAGERRSRLMAESDLSQKDRETMKVDEDHQLLVASSG